ncbi:MAG: regulatory protein [Gammaproteobacteria bacterium]
MANKLARRCVDEALIEDLLDTLSSEGLQSDVRFTESFVHHSLNKGQGPNKITQELRQRGIEQVLIEQCLESESIDWMLLAEEVRVKKYGESVPGDYQVKAKQSRFLYSRGFSSEQISQLLK